MPGITDPSEEYFKDGLWAWVTDQWKKLVADASNFLQINVAAQDIDVEIKQTTAADLTPGVMGWDGEAWHKLPILWGYSAKWVEVDTHVMASDATYTFLTTAVPAGYVHVVQAMSIHNNTGARGPAFAVIRHVGTSHNLVYTAAPAVSEPTAWWGKLALSEGDQVRVSQYGCLTNDVMRAVVWGYKMKVAE